MHHGELDVIINLRRDGDQLLDLLKAVIREWQGAPWPHERERAVYALNLYQQCLNQYRSALEQARSQVEQGYNTLGDQKLITDLEQKIAYWEKKLAELTNR